MQGFINKHKKEHLALNLRVLNATQELSGIVKRQLKDKDLLEQQAMVLTCNSEFIAIQQQLSLHDEKVMNRRSQSL